MDKLRAYWQKNKLIWRQILLLFIITRLALSLIGWISITYLPQKGVQDWKNQTIKIEHPYLQMWAVWDSQWYLKIAEQGYADDRPFVPTEYSTIGFFPLYPATILIIEFITGDFLLAGWLVSNFFFLLAAYFLYKLIKLDHDEAAAKRGLWYLFLFPSAYIFSAVYPESMLLSAWLASIFYARKGVWWTAGLTGFLAALIKPVGFFIVIPLLWLYLFREKKFCLTTFSQKIKINFNIVFTALPLIGLLLWSFGNYLLTGDFLAYSHIQQGAWHHYFSSPFTTLYKNLFRDSNYLFNSLTTIFAFLVLVFGYKKIPFAYWLFALVAILFNPATGTVVCAWRYLASVFPLLIILVGWGKSETADRAILTSLALLQGCLFIFWVAGFWFVA